MEESEVSLTKSQKEEITASFQKIYNDAEGMESKGYKIIDEVMKLNVLLGIEIWM